VSSSDFLNLDCEPGSGSPVQEWCGVVSLDLGSRNGCSTWGGRKQSGVSEERARKSWGVVRICAALELREVGA
jgi:hypothetical protein